MIAACTIVSSSYAVFYLFLTNKLIPAVTASYCSQYEAFQAFSWLNWLILFSYWVTLLIIALVAQSRGNKRAFLVPSTELTSTMPGNSGEPKIPPTQNYPPGSITPGTYPPQGQYPQQSYTPGQHPQQSYTPSQYPQQSYTPSPMPPQGQMYQAPYVSSPPPHSTNAIPV